MEVSLGVKCNPAMRLAAALLPSLGVVTFHFFVLAINFTS